MSTMSASDAIENRARNLLNNSPIPELRRLQIEEVDGVLCLVGSLSTWYYKQLAQELLRRLTPGAVSIRNLTQVNGNSLGARASRPHNSSM